MGKGGESSSSASLRSGGGGASVKGSSGVAASVSSEVLIDGVWYDVSSFKHPGGRVLSYYAGRDATQVGPTVHHFCFLFFVWFSFFVVFGFFVFYFRHRLL